MYAASLLEVVNQVEHFGLLRKLDASGHCVRCEPEHPWNSKHLLVNLLLYQLQRHCDPTPTGDTKRCGILLAHRNCQQARP